MNPVSEKASNKISNMALVCSCLVVFIHLREPSVNQGGVGVFHYLIRHVFAAIAVPYFFVVSGYFLGRRCNDPAWYVRAIKTRIKSLLVPYIVWNLFFLLLLLCLQDEFLPIGLFDGAKPILIQTWYLKALMIFVIISPLLVWLISKVPKCSIALVCALCLGMKFLLSEPYWKTLLEYTFSLSGLIYFMIGLGIAKYEGIYGSISTLNSCILGLVGFVSGVCGLVFRMYGGESGMLIARGIKLIATPLVLIGIWALIPCNEWPKWIVKMAFPIYILHMFVIRVTNKLSDAMGIDYITSIGLTLLMFGVVLMSSFLVAQLLKRAFPHYSRYLWGGR